ncbi:MAG: type II toxin-antitoxin system prevent-host-death family antitoxin [Acidobacteria bacterium]|nr:type II toxin-antitoxin system prevent-host-death family antitoxin [Acidobacteriota bacterium]
MAKAVSAADANRNFSQLLRDVREGRECVITNHGKPVARLVRLEAQRDVRAAARAVLFKRLRSQPATPRAGRWTRDELYED